MGPPLVANELERHARSVTASKVGYVVALAHVEEPDEYDEFVALVLEGASQAFIGPRDDQ